MNAADWTVVLGGLAAIAWINWYFFLAGRPGASASVPALRRQKHKEEGGR